jgi:glycerol uptake facilitator-like aquaporin
LTHRLAAEGLGTAFLLACVVGSGIMGERLAGGNMAIALLANAIATGGILVALIAALGPISGAHMNPVVTMAAAAAGHFRWPDVGPYILVQILGAILGTIVANAMFALPLIQSSQHARGGAGQWLAEIIATAGLLMTIRGCRAYAPPVVGAAVASYIVAAYWFTSSTSFANPAVTIARSLSDTFAGIRPGDIPGFIVAQLAGLALVVGTTRLAGRQKRRADA